VNHPLTSPCTLCPCHTRSLHPTKLWQLPSHDLHPATRGTSAPCQLRLPPPTPTCELHVAPGLRPARVKLCLAPDVLNLIHTHTAGRQTTQQYDNSSKQHRQQWQADPTAASRRRCQCPKNRHTTGAVQDTDRGTHGMHRHHSCPLFTYKQLQPRGKTRQSAVRPTQPCHQAALARQTAARGNCPC